MTWGLNSASLMQNTFSIDVSFMRFFCGFEVTEMYFLLVCSYLCLVIIIALKSYYPAITGSVIRLWIVPVFGVEFMICFTKIAYSIIKFVTVDMVYLAIRPFAINIKPSKTMGCIFLLFRPFADTDVKIFVSIPRINAADQSIAMFSAPTICGWMAFKKASFRAIVEFRFKQFLRKHLALRNSIYSDVGNSMITATKRLANPVPTACILT